MHVTGDTHTNKVHVALPIGGFADLFNIFSYFICAFSDFNTINNNNLFGEMYMYTCNGGEFNNKRA